MHIALIHPSLEALGGSQLLTFWLAEGFWRHGHTCTLYTCHYAPHRFEPLGFPVEVRRVPAPLSLRPEDGMAVGELLAPELVTFDLIINLNFPSYVWTYAARQKIKGFPPVIWYCQEPPRIFHRDVMLDSDLKNLCLQDNVPGLQRWPERTHDGSVELEVEAGRSNDLIVANSHFVGGYVQRIYGIKAEVCWPGVPLHRICHPEPIVRTPWVRTVSRPAPIKNLIALLAAMALLKEEGFGLEVLGVGSHDRKLEELRQKLGLDRVRLRGLIPGPELPAFYASALLVAYIPLDEPFGLVPVEAMANRTAVIAANQGGPVETIVDGETGLLVDPLNPVQIASAISRLASDPDRCAQMGARGARRVEENFTLARMMERFFPFIERVGGKG